MKIRSNFVAFILTNGRPDRVYTYELLRRSGYTGPIILIVDDEDWAMDAYIEKYGKEVVVFSKDEMAKNIDVGDNFSDRRAIIYARTVAPKIAKNLGYTYFLQLDDDYTEFAYRMNESFQVRYRCCRNLDSIFEIFLRLFDDTPVKSVAMSQGGDFIGGSSNYFLKYGIVPKRKCMNTFFCSVDRPFQFAGTMNEDVTNYVLAGSRGSLFFTVMDFSIKHMSTQINAGGMSEMYQNSGTYVKSFYSVMFNPSCVTINMMGDKFYRLHHRVSWNNAVPKILSEDLKKK